MYMLPLSALRRTSTGGVQIGFAAIPSHVKHVKAHNSGFRTSIALCSNSSCGARACVRMDVCACEYELIHTSIPM